MSGRMDDTICAIATPVGEGGIGIIRISGDKALELTSGVVRLRSGRSLLALPSHTLHHADVLEAQAPTTQDGPVRAARVLDEALVVVMRAPRSYTAEDVVEIQCHGGSFVMQALCEALTNRGARLAEPGEFTKRAFLNGRLDLTQAEAVLDTICATTEGSLRVAQEQLRGALSKDIDRMRETLIRLLAHVEAAIDFTEEDIAFIQRDELMAGLQHTLTGVTRLVESYREGRILREGMTAALVGRPNVGKSSLLNALLRTDRAIVTPRAGTTRDVLEEVLNIHGVPVRLLDTAGLRDTNDPVEQEGIKRSRAAMARAELLLILLDGSVPLHADDEALLQQAKGRKAIIIINKSDLPQCLDLAHLRPPDTATRSPSMVCLSAKTAHGLEDLRGAIRGAVFRAGFEPGEGAVATRQRHRTSLVKAGEALSKALESVSANLSGEFVAMDLRGAIDALGEITGATSTDDILDRIFREFCIGK